MLIYTTDITPRIQYIADFFGKEITGESFSITSDKAFYLNDPGPKINYSQAALADQEIWISPHPLLFETSILTQQVKCFVVNGEKAFFETDFSTSSTT